MQDSLICNNVLYNNHASGISLYRIDGLLPAADNVIVNNTIINGSGADPVTRWCLNIADASTGNVVFNNILLNYHASRGSIIISDDSLDGFVSDHNVVMNRLDPDGDGPTPTLTLAQWQAATGEDMHSIAVPPGMWSALFENLGAWDLHLAQGSGAENIGAAMIAGEPAPTMDADGVPAPAAEGVRRRRLRTPRPLPAPRISTPTASSAARISSTSSPRSSTPHPRRTSTPTARSTLRTSSTSCRVLHRMLT